jgi:hypothetical protein
MYDGLSKAEKAKNSDTDNFDKQLNYAWYSKMAAFYSIYYKLQKDKPDTQSRRATRQTVLNMVMEFEKNMENGYRSPQQEAIENYSKKTGKTELLPAALDSTLKIDDNTSYTLTDAEYVDMQTDYLGLYYDYVTDALNGKYKTETEKESAVRAAKAKAADKARQDALEVAARATNNTKWLEQKMWDGLSAKAQEQYIVNVKLAGVKLKTYADVLEYDANAVADKDEDGATISGSKKEKVMNYIDNLNVTDKQKDALYLSLGYSEDTMWEAPWN